MREYYGMCTLCKVDHDHSLYDCPKLHDMG